MLEIVRNATSIKFKPANDSDSISISMLKSVSVLADKYGCVFRFDELAMKFSIWISDRVLSDTIVYEIIDCLQSIFKGVRLIINVEDVIDTRVVDRDLNIKVVQSMLDWKRVYDFDEMASLNLSDYIRSGGIIDWKLMLADLNVKNTLYVKFECNGTYTAALKFSGVDFSPVSESRLVYCVLALLCEMFRNLIDLKNEHIMLKRDVKLYFSVISHTYKVNNLSISVNIQEMRVVVLTFDSAIKKVVKGSVYTNNESKELSALIDELYECKTLEKCEIVVDKIKKEDCDSDIILISGDETLVEFMTKLPDSDKDLYLSFRNEVFLKITKYSGSELHKLGVICESCWFLGYCYLSLSDNLRKFVVRLFNTDTIQTDNYKMKLFKGDFGVVRKGLKV